MSHIQMKNSTGRVVEVKMGFSWTTLLFSFIPDLIRGRIAITLVLIFAQLMTAGLAAIIWSFFRNKNLFNDYLEQGYKPIITSKEQKATLSGWLGYEFIVNK